MWWRALLIRKFQRKGFSFPPIKILTVSSFSIFVLSPIATVAGGGGISIGSSAFISCGPRTNGIFASLRDAASASAASLALGVPSRYKIEIPGIGNAACMSQATAFHPAPLKIPHIIRPRLKVSEDDAGYTKSLVAVPENFASAFCIAADASGQICRSANACCVAISSFWRIRFSDLSRPAMTSLAAIRSFDCLISSLCSFTTNQVETPTIRPNMPIKASDTRIMSSQPWREKPQIILTFSDWLVVGIVGLACSVLLLIASLFFVRAWKSGRG